MKCPRTKSRSLFKTYKLLSCAVIFYVGLVFGFTNDVSKYSSRSSKLGYVESTEQIDEYNPNCAVDLKSFLGQTETNAERALRLKVPMPSRFLKTNPSELAVDFVFKWVDGSRPDHLLQKSCWRTHLKNWPNLQSPTGAYCPAIDFQQDSARRERNNDELMFALRSIHMHVPWFRHIFIVVEGPHMIPDWLDLEYPQISLVYHADIFPEPITDFLPTFNGHAIASVLHQIPHLSKYYIVMDDDFFFTSNVTLEHFFGVEGGEIISLKGIQVGNMILPSIDERDCPSAHHHEASNSNSAYMLTRIREDGETSNFKGMQHAPYVSSKLLQTYLLSDIFPNETMKLRTHRFRSKADFHVQSLAFNFAQSCQRNRLNPNLKQGQASNLRHTFQGLNPARGANIFSQFRNLAKENEFMCINDDMPENVSDAFIQTWHEFLSATWPVIAPWESQSSNQVL